MEMSFVQSMKLAIVAALGLSKDALHIYVGLGAFLSCAYVFRRPIKSFTPWLAVLLVAVLGELLDARDDIRSLGHWRYGASSHDIVNTIFWPTVLFLVARFTTLFSTKSSG